MLPQSPCPLLLPLRGMRMRNSPLWRGLGRWGREEASISTGAIVGITLGVLAAAGLGGAVAVQQEWLKLPDPLNAQVLGGMASLSSALSIPGPAPKPAEKPAVGSCPPAAFNAAVPEWPAGFGTSVSYCDGRWAVAGAKGTDWILFFKHLNGKWAKISSDGTTRRGMTRACYNGIKLREQGAAEAFMREVPVCTPGEIGRWGVGLRSGQVAQGPWVVDRSSPRALHMIL